MQPNLNDALEFCMFNLGHGIGLTGLYQPILLPRLILYRPNAQSSFLFEQDLRKARSSQLAMQTSDANQVILVIIATLNNPSKKEKFLRNKFTEGLPAEPKTKACRMAA
jgi:hypothetical protein